MSEDFDEYLEDEYRDDEPRPSLWRRGLFILVVFLIIFTLLGSSIVNFAWFVSGVIRSAADFPAANTNILPAATRSVAAAATIAPADIPTIAVATAAPAVTTADTPPSPNLFNRIAYINPDQQVVTIAPDGTNRRLLTDSLIAFQFPAWSPDGRQVAVIGRANAGGGVYIVNDVDDGRQTADLQRLYFSGRNIPIYLYWAPDSRQVSFIVNWPGNTLGFQVAATDTEADSRVITTGNPLYWNWTAGGDQLLLHVGSSDEGPRLAIVDADGNGDNIAVPGSFQAPGVSAGGRYLAYAEAQGFRSSRLVVTDLQTGTQQRQAHQGRVALGWSPTADRLAFISTARDEFEFIGPLRLLDAQTGAVQVLSEATVLAFFWSPDGRYLATITQSDQEEGEIFASANRSPRSLRAKPGQQQFELPSLTLSVIDVTTGEGRFLTSFQPTLTFLTQFLPFFDQYALSHSLWSPHSNALVLPMQGGDVNQIVVVAIGSGQQQPIAVGDMAFWSRR